MMYDYSKNVYADYVEAMGKETLLKLQDSSPFNRLSNVVLFLLLRTA